MLYIGLLQVEICSNLVTFHYDFLSWKFGYMIMFGPGELSRVESNETTGSFPYCALPKFQPWSHMVYQLPLT